MKRLVLLAIDCGNTFPHSPYSADSSRIAVCSLDGF